MNRVGRCRGHTRGWIKGGILGAAFADDCGKRLKDETSEKNSRSQRSFIPTQHSIWQKKKGPPENALYRPRRPQDSSYYHCVEDHFETFEQVYEERFERGEKGVSPGNHEFPYHSLVAHA